MARRQHLVARLPNIRTLNGGDPVSEVEREQAERAFIRAFLDTEPGARPGRWAELVAVHGELEPLVKIDLTPETGRYQPAGSIDIYTIYTVQCSAWVCGTGRASTCCTCLCGSG